jgi:hypothetical protein
MRKRKCGAPPSARKDISTSSSKESRKVRTDLIKQPFPSSPGANGTGADHTGTARSSDVSSRGVYKQQQAFKRRKRLQLDRVHQPISCIVRGTSDTSGSGVRCMYKKCRGLDIKSKRIVSYKTIYQYGKCTAEQGSPLWLCHTTKKIDGKHTVVSYHLRYHAKKKFIVGGTESSVVSDLPEE